MLDKFMMMLELSSMAVFMSAVVVAAKLKLVCNEPDTQKERNRTDKWNLINWLLYAIIEEGHNKTFYNLILIETLVRRNFEEWS